MEVKYFGQYLIAKNLIKREDLVRAMDFQRMTNISLGEFALKKSLITESEFEKIANLQLSKNMSFIAAAQEINVFSADEVDLLIAKQKSNNILLGEALVQLNIIERDKIDSYFSDFRKEQSVLEFEILNAISSSSYSDIFELCIQSVTNLCRYLLDVRARIGGFDEKADSLPETEYSSCYFTQEIQGAQNIKLMLFISDRMLTDIASSLLRQTVEELNEYAIDSGKEFLNIVAGYICTGLSLQDVHSNPSIPEAGDFKEADISSSHTRVPLVFPGDVLFVDIFI